MDPQTYRLTDRGNFGRYALYLGIAGLATSLAGFFIDREHFFSSYLVAYAFWFSIGIGGLFFVMLHHLTNSTWSVVLRRLAENIMMVIPLLAILFIPLIFGMRELYDWSLPQIVGHEELLQKKAPYLNVPFFIIRAVIYFGAWSFIAWKLYKASLAQDKGFEENRIAKMRAVSAPGMVIFALTLTFASFDWFMSLDAKWYSTIFGAYIFAGSSLGMLAFLILVAVYLRRRGILAETITIEHYHDLAKLMFTFVILWSYFAFSQYLLIWYANIPEEVTWYRQRWGGWWTFVSMLIVYGHFVLPFVVLLARAPKRNLAVLRLIAVWILFIHWVDLYWVIMPGLGKGSAHFSWMHVATMVGIGGIFLWFFWRRLSSSALITLNDPRLAASIELVSE